MHLFVWRFLTTRSSLNGNDFGARGGAKIGRAMASNVSIKMLEYVVHSISLTNLRIVISLFQIKWKQYWRTRSKTDCRSLENQHYS